MKQSRQPLKRSRTPVVVMALALLTIFISAFMADRVHTSGGQVQIRDIRFVTQDGGLMRALLYIPQTASPEHPAPAVVAMHGYNNTAEMQDINAIELSRRGIVVLAFDSYAHGHSSYPDSRVNNGFVQDLGTFAALQYLKVLPYVDLSRVGMVGHSMGGSAIQDGALRAFQARESDPSVVVPVAILPTANSFTLDADGQPLLARYPVNLGSVFGKYDEWVLNMWGVHKGSEAIATPKAKTAMGVTDPKYDTYYRFGSDQPLDRAGALQAAADKQLRVLFQPHVDHPMITFSNDAARDVADFFDITLLQGKSPLPADDLTWYGKELGSGIAFLAFFVFLGAFGLVLLRAPYFQAIVRPEPDGLTTITNGASKVRYVVIYILGLLPAPLLFNWFIGYCYANPIHGRVVDILFNASAAFPLACVNGIFLLNIVVGLILLALYLYVFFTVARKAGCTIRHTGLDIPARHIWRAAVWAVCVFAAGYATLLLCEAIFGIDYRYFVFSIKSLDPAKWWIYLRYLPSFLFFFLVTAMTLNTFTRINGLAEWKNVLLIVGASIGGLAVLSILDYGTMYVTGVKMFEFVPFSGRIAAFCGLFVWNMLVALSVSALLTRLFFKATGSIWAGGFLNALVITLFATSNTIVAVNVLP